MTLEHLFGQRVGGFLRKWGSLIAIIIAVLGAGLSGVLYTQLHTATGKLATATAQLERATSETHQDLVSSCQRVGEPTRLSQIDDLNEKISDSRKGLKATHNVNLVRTLFPNVSNSKIQKLERKQRKDLTRKLSRAQRNKAALVSAPACTERYPAPLSSQAP